MFRNNSQNYVLNDVDEGGEEGCGSSGGDSWLPQFTIS